MSDYTPEDCFFMLGYFPHRYTNVVQHARFPKLTFSETQILSPKTKVLGEFIAAAGYQEIDFSLLRNVIDFVDDYLRTGIFDKEACSKQVQALSPLNDALMEVANDFTAAGLADEDGVGAPAVLFAHNNALLLLQTCHMIETMTEPDKKLELLALCEKRKRNDPDPDREDVPALV